MPTHEEWLAKRLEENESAVAYLAYILGRSHDKTDEERKESLANALIAIGRAHGIEIKRVV